MIFKKSIDNFEIAYKTCSILVWLYFSLNLIYHPILRIFSVENVNLEAKG